MSPNMWHGIRVKIRDGPLGPCPYCGTHKIIPQIGVRIEKTGKNDRDEIWHQKVICGTCSRRVKAWEKVIGIGEEVPQ